MSDYPLTRLSECALSAEEPQAEALSFEGFALEVLRSASVLKMKTVQAGDRIALLGANSMQYVVLIHALQRIGASAVLLNTRLNTQDWESQLALANCKLLLVDDKIAEFRDFSETVASLESLSFKSVFKASLNAEVLQEQAPFEADREAVVIFTSGSSGHLKGVRISLGNFAASAAASNEITGLKAGDTWLVSLPLYHLGGLGIVNRTLYAGAEAHIIRSASEAALASAICSRHISHLSVVPTQLEALIENLDEQRLKALKAIFVAGAPSSERLLRKIEALQLPILSAYGMTETTAHCCCMRLGDPISRVHGVGKAFPNTLIEVVNEAGEVQPSGSAGEIRFRGPTVCLGYLGESGHAWTTDAYLYSGDLGVFDAEGYLRILGRKDDMFISGGENIHPGEIENTALEHPAVALAAVLAIDDPRWGKRPVLFVQAQPKAELCSDRLNEFLEEKLAKIKIPDKIYIIETMPKTAIGKNNYARLRTMVSTEPQNTTGNNT